MENRLELNKKPTYELPNDVIVSDYRRGVKKPNFKPDICITYRGSIGVAEADKHHKQIWIKTENKDLLDFIKDYNWKNASKSLSTPDFNLSKFKKILLEEFYGVKDGE
jgi:hypothetical protein